MNASIHETPSGANHKRTGKTPEAFRSLLENNLYFTQGTTVQSASRHDAYVSLAYTVRDHLIDRWRRTSDAQYEANPKFVYYLSAEYLLGQQLTQNLLYSDTWQLALQLAGDWPCSIIFP